MIAYMGKGFVSEFWLGTILGGLNQMIYSFVSVLCGLFSDISGIILFNDEVVEAFTRRIYVILGIYMLFRLAISLLNSIVNPDNLLDKEKGLQKIIPRSVIALAMLVFVPSIFSLAFKYQNRIALAVPRIIIGKGSVENMEGQGEILAASALKAFFVPNESECTDTTDIDAAYNQLNTNDVDYMLSKLPTQACSSNSKVFLYQFNGVVSIVAGVFMVISLASYCVDIAIRSIKLGLLQILAPIPIISYIDPKSEKDGAFSHWTKECVSTYLELFIKLAILYFVIFILSSIATDGGKLLGSTNGANPSNPFILTFLIIGALFFMGKAAEFICNIIGVKPPKENGGFFKGLAGIAGLAGLGLSTIGSAISSGKAALTAAKVNNPNISKGSLIARTIAGGVFGGLANSVSSASMIANKKGFMDIMNAANTRNAQNMRMAEEGGTFFGGVGSFLRSSVIGSESDALEADWKLREEQIKAEKEESQRLANINKHRKTIMDRVSSKAATSLKTTGSFDYNGRTISGNGASFNSVLSAAKSGTGVYKQSWYENSYGDKISEADYRALDSASRAYFDRKESSEAYFRFNGQEIALSEGDIIAKGLMDSNEDNYYEQALANANFDPAITSEVGLFEAESGQAIEDKYGSGLKATFGNESTRLSQLDYNISEKSQKITKERNERNTKRVQANEQRYKAKK